ncbi:tetratricopeptide repeat protein [Microbispora sp. H10885]|uniref:tetratricopeptide repeat protein n=1 Tax=Microbispora sp. H10885 TaxID=2729110 RepID=UPI001604407F|nr:tetratricopeptide repeat protein [Microbispora sp. H10885]
MKVAIEQAASSRNSIVWLSDLENYLGTGGLSREHITRIISGDGHRRVILATMRSAVQAELTSRSTPENATDLAVREIREALEQAEQIRLTRMFSEGEIARARTYEKDARISDALLHAHEYGIAEYLASGPELQRDYENAWDIGANPRGAALVAAAINCRRIGFLSPIPRTLLENLHLQYLDERGGRRLQPEPLEQAWAWATRPRRATTALLSLMEGDEHVDVFDYLVDVKQRTSGPRAELNCSLINAALPYASRDDAENLGEVAYALGDYQLAVAALQVAVSLHLADLGEGDLSTLICMNNLGNMLRHSGRLDEAEEAFKTALAGIRKLLAGEETRDSLVMRSGLALTYYEAGRLGEAERELELVHESFYDLLGGDHIDTLICRGNWLEVIRESGRLAEAEAGLSVLLRSLQEKLGDSHPLTWHVYSNLARAVGEQGRLPEAEAHHRALYEIRRAALGEDHPDTLISRGGLARILGDLGRFDEAISHHKETARGFERLRHTDHPEALTNQMNYGIVLQTAGQIEASIAKFKSVLQRRTAVLGPKHHDTLVARGSLVSVLIGNDQLSEAEVHAKGLAGDCIEALGSEHMDTLIIKSHLARLLLARKNIRQASQEFRDIFETMSRLLGEDHPETLTNRGLLAYSLAVLGHVEAALREQKAVVESARRTLGNEHPQTLIECSNYETLSKARQLGVPIRATFETAAPSRNKPCVCGSGKKFKYCHGRK